MSEVGELGVPLLEANLRTEMTHGSKLRTSPEKHMPMEPYLSYPLGHLLTELCGSVKVLHEVWQQAEHVQRKACWAEANDFS